MRVEMDDGVALRADVYRPEGAGPHHVLLISHPYDKLAALSNYGYAHPSWYARQGYIVVAQDTRGRYRSEGTFYPLRHEASDVARTIEWASRLSGSTGKVATYGFSYPGLDQLLAAQLGPAGLAAISPAFTGGRPYQDWFYRQGAFSLAFAASWANYLALDVAARREDDGALAGLAQALASSWGLYWALPLTAHPALAGDEAPFYRDWLDHPTHDDYWQTFDVDFASVEVPGLHVGGWWDIFVRGTVNDFTALAAKGRAPQKLLLGPWHHMPWRPLGDASGEVGPGVVDDWQLRFWRRVLDGEETGVFDHAATVYVMGDGWRDFDAWPPPGSRPSSGTCAPTAARSRSSGREPSRPSRRARSRPTSGSTSPASSRRAPAVTPAAPRISRRWDRPTRMRWSGRSSSSSTPAIRSSGSWCWSGTSAVTLFASTSAPDTDFSARLCLVDATGASTNLVEGIVRARSRDSLERPSPVQPGEAYEYHIDLGPVGVRIPAGHRLRLQVGSSDFPQWDRNLNTGGPIGKEPASAMRSATQVVLHDQDHPSRVTLPVLE